MSSARAISILAITVLAEMAVAAEDNHVPLPAEFINRAATSGTYEIEASRLALTRSSSATIKAFAQTMIIDHAKAAEELKAAAGRFPIPEELDSAHQDLMQRLSAAAADVFDKTYWQQQTDAHKEAVSLFTLYSANGENGAVKGFAAKTLPILQHHQTMLGQMEAQFGQ